MIKIYVTLKLWLMIELSVNYLSQVDNYL